MFVVPPSVAVPLAVSNRSLQPEAGFLGDPTGRRIGHRVDQLDPPESPLCQPSGCRQPHGCGRPTFAAFGWMGPVADGCAEVLLVDLVQ